MLPPLPSFLPAKPADALEPDNTIYPDPSPEAGPSKPRHPLSNSNSSTSTECNICSSPFKYTCPRCSTRTCSLPCIKVHKSQTGCNGTRDPTKFVTLSEFGQGDWGGDYAYLESGRRRIADWGKDLPPALVEGRENNSGRGRSGRQANGNGSARRGPSKVEGLKRELERRGVEVEFMAEGMGRRKLNQSSWNPKTQTLHLTIQLQIPQSLLGNAESLDSKTLNHLRVIYASPTAELPTLSSLLPPPIKAEDIVLLLPFHPSYSNPTPIDILLRHPRPRLYFPPLAMDLGLGEAFRGMSWVEFPVLTVMSKGEWERKMREGVVAIVPISQTERGEKRKFDPTPIATATPPSEGGEKKPKTYAGGGLAGLGDYDSASEGEVEEETEGLDVLGAEDDDGHGEGDQMVITQEDVEVLHALGAAAAADMA